MFTLTIEAPDNQAADQLSFDRGSYVVGRLDECDVVLPSSSVSREHARIFIENGRCFIEDLDSANGVAVDGQKVVQRRDLGTASQIRIGQFYLYLESHRTGQHPRPQSLDTLFISNNADHHKLVRISDSFAGEEFGLSEKQNTIGRTDENFILLSDQSISRQHAKIVRNGNAYTLVDLNSSNGTRLNGRTVRRPKQLSAGDRVTFGDIDFVFAAGDTPIDARAVQAHDQTRRTLKFYAGLAAVVVAGLVLGAIIVYGLLWANG